MKPWKLPWFLALYLVDLFRANLTLAHEVLRIRPRLVSGIIGVDVEVTGWRLVLLTNLITLTPGTVSLDVSDDGHRLYVHVLDPVHPYEARESVRRLQDRVTEVFG